MVVVDDVFAGGGGELSPSRSKVLLLVTVVVGEASTAEALLSSSWGRPVLGLCPDDWKRGIVNVNQSRRGLYKIIKYYLGFGQWSGNRSGLRCGGLLLDAGGGNGAQDCTATASSGQRLFLALLFLKLLVDFLFPVDLEER